MPRLTIDGLEVTAPEGTNLIQAARLLKKSIPHYCYHKKLSIAGNCRICLVEIEKQQKLQIACNTPVHEGMVVWTASPRVALAKQSVMEFILINHPIDCPVCDQAGECKLQRYYMQHDLEPSRMTEPKVQKEKAIALGPQVMLDMERCILCSRCVRFCQEVAKVDELCFAERGDHTLLTTSPGRRLENPYSLNTVDICPVGALTSRDFRFRQRVWLLKQTPSVCPGCATGCNIEIDHNRGEIFRLRPRENDQVNQCWMCDEGRMTFKSVKAANRLRTALGRGGEGLTEAHWDAAIQAVADLTKGVPGGQILGVGSAEFSNEENGALIAFLKSLGVEEFAYHAREVPNPSHDEILISADKNPNRAGVEALGMKPLSALERRYRLFFILGSLPVSEIAPLALDRLRRVVLFATHRDAALDYADWVFPVPTWAEQEGSFTNRTRRVQRFEKAFDPPGESQSVAQILAQIEKVREGAAVRGAA